MADIAGFKTTKYPDVATGKDVDLYVCNKCSPSWDTFDANEAKAHAEAGVHREIGQATPVPPTTETT